MKRNRLTGMVLDHIGRGLVTDHIEAGALLPPATHAPATRGPDAGVDDAPLTPKQRHRLRAAYAKADADLARWLEDQAREESELLAAMNALSGEPELLRMADPLDCDLLGVLLAAT